jgi:hypothetical protein
VAVAALDAESLRKSLHGLQQLLLWDVRRQDLEILVRDWGCRRAATLLRVRR